MREPLDHTPFSRISEDVVEYVNMRIASTKLSLVEGLSRVSGNAIRLVVFVLFCGLALMAFLLALISWLATVVDSVALAAVIAGAFCLIVGLILLASRKLFINPMVKMYSGMVFSKRKRKRDED